MQVVVLRIGGSDGGDWQLARKDRDSKRSGRETPSLTHDKETIFARACRPRSVEIRTPRERQSSVMVAPCSLAGLKPARIENVDG